MCGNWTVQFCSVLSVFSVVCYIMPCGKLAVRTNVGISVCTTCTFGNDGYTKMILFEIFIQIIILALLAKSRD